MDLQAGGCEALSPVPRLHVCALVTQGSWHAALRPVVRCWAAGWVLHILISALLWTEGGGSEPRHPVSAGPTPIKGHNP